MGNSIQKKKRKKVETEENFSAPLSPKLIQAKSKGLWLFGRQDKVKTAGPKGNDDGKRLAVHYKTSQHHQENVFIEGSRPQYLEDLHTEAQEGLKILQQEENKNGVNFTDDESISSSGTLRPEQDISSKDGGGSSVSRASTGNTDTTVTSSVSTRPVLTRQGSTFKPLNPVKRLDKSRKRTRRTTIMGIPNHVQKELALNRSSTFQPLASVQHPVNDGPISDSQTGVVIIPTVDGGTPTANKEGARVHLSDLEASRDERLFRKQLQAMYQDEQPFSHQAYGSHHYPTSGLRPKSLAVPSSTVSSTFCPTTMCSFLQEPPGPVMSMSPQATYLSTIIPNAVLPASVEVIEIDRSISRARGSSVNLGGSVRTVSKNSLASRDSSVSPLLSRRSGGDGFQTEYSCNDSSQAPKSTSGSNWSESSRTMRSDSSPASSKSSSYSANSQRAGLNGQESQQEHLGGDQDHVSLCSSVSGISNSKSESTVQGSDSGSFTTCEDAKNKRNFARNLSVMKTKQPPAPPRRTNSLHINKMKSSSGILVESKDLIDSVSGRVETATETAGAKDTIKSVGEIPTPVSNSSGSSSPDVSSSPLSPTTSSSKEAEMAQEPQSESSNSSPQKVLADGGKFERTMSPSSGYSSQSGTPTLSPKGVSPTSPGKQKKPVKPERSASRAGSSSAASPSSSLTSLSSGTSEPAHADVSSCSHNAAASSPVASNELLPNNISSTMRVEFRELLDIPPPPKVKAPCPPPPETWAHNRRTFELLCGGPLLGVSKDAEKAPRAQEITVQQAGGQNETGGETQVLTENQTVAVEAVFEPSDAEQKPETLVAADLEDNREEKEDKELPAAETEGVEESAEVQRQEQRSSPELMSPKTPVTPQRKDPPPVMKKPAILFRREEQATAEASVAKEAISAQAEAVVENNATSSQSEASAETADNHAAESEVPSAQTPSVEGAKVNKVSPPPSPPPEHHPTPPPSRKTPPPSVSTPPEFQEELQQQEEEAEEEEEEIQAVESCWPPPPPPLEGDSVFEGGDEVDFPPPPPPLPCVTDVVDICAEKLDFPTECTVCTEEVGETNVSLSEAGTTEHEEGPDLLVSQSTEDVSKPQDDTQLLEPNSVELSCSVLSDMDDSPPPPEEVPPAPPAPTSPPAPPVPPTLLSTKAEDTVSLPALVPSGSFLRRDSLKTGDPVSAAASVSVQTPPCTVPPAPPFHAETITHGVNFRRQPSVANRDSRSKELLSRHKSAPIPKEDANIPLVTPSLLQMVRLRSVNVTEDQVDASTEDDPLSQGTLVQDSCPASIPGNSANTPQKPIRKSLSLKSPPHMVKSPVLSAPSMRLQEAIRMKTAAMSSRDGLPSRLGVRTPTFGCAGEPGPLSLRSPDGYDMNKSPASAASFIFSRSAKKVVIETPAAAASPEAQACLKQSLAAELMQVSDQSRSPAFLNGGVRCDKVPPPVAKKPGHGSASSQEHPACSGAMENSGQGNGAAGEQHLCGITHPETTITRVTADTIETLF